MRAVALTLTILLAVALFLPWQGGSAGAVERQLSIRMPWKQAGLDEREAAAHLLYRFAYGPRPGQIEEVLKTGLERWFERQLAANLPDRKVRDHLRDLPVLEMSAAEIARRYPNPGRVLAEARRNGVLPEDVERGSMSEAGRRKLRAEVREWAQDQGYRSQRELIGQLMAQKLYRAVESENQLAEVMTDFWFNHFNVSLTDNQARGYLLSYERDAIRPHALDRVRSLLGATARHPAMLLYLDNAQSSASAEAVTTLEEEIGRLPRRRLGFGERGMGMMSEEAVQRRMRRPRGLNENYARELLELHTLGVDGGYTQDDVVQVARAFTGWTVLPPGRRQAVRRAGGMGFQAEGEFLFRADMHDAAEKVVLGQSLPAGRGVEDGEQVLDMLAVHPSTARHLATKLAVRFVSDQPPKALVDRLSAVYLRSGGDVRALLSAIAESPEFWSREAVAAKIKSPFELAASAIRVLDGHVEEPRGALDWVRQMGQPLYAYQAPTGYPDRAEAWVNTGALLSRMSFGLQLASGRVNGVDLDLPGLNRGREPESRD
ncbi:MAG TPA: DUF1800 domain-containing protein, partial [Thermoanaerobaculia bacterium]